MLKRTIFRCQKDKHTIYEKRNHLLLTPKKKDKTKQKVQTKEKQLSKTNK